LAHWVQALPRGEPAVQHVVVAVRRALLDAAVAPRQEAVAARDAGRQAAVLAGAGLQREAPGAPAAGLPSVAAWAAVWVFRRDQAPPWPAP
jgi:hypothetical protein